MTTLLVPWLALPLVLATLSLGCGLLLERAAGVRLPGPLVLPSGLAALIVVALLATMHGATARLATPAVVACAAAGVALSLRRRFRPDAWAAVAALGVFLAYAAPVVLSGRATFPGYIKLDDDATFLANLDRAMGHGRDLSGLAPSSYLATLQPHLAKGYPLGAFMPIGVGRRLVGGDALWLYQPALALMAAMLALVLYELAARAVEPRWLRALAAFVGAQSALLYGYGLWGGIKEVGAAWLIALAGALVLPVARGEGRVRSFLPLAMACAALLGLLSAGAAVWLWPAAGAAVLAVALARARPTAVRAVLGFAVLLVVLSLPTIVVARTFLGNRIFEYDYLANLIRPLNSAQLAGIWPAGDFRVNPDRRALTYALIAVAAAACAAALLSAARRRAWEVPLYVAGVVVCAFVFFTFSTPWIEGKALATASPAIPFAAVLCCAPLWASGRRVEGATVAAVVAGGVLWSNVLQYHDAWLAPRAQLHELQRIGNRFAGEGPALMTEYNPYGARHLLRKLDGEGASELRIRPVPLLNGQLLPKGAYADLDDFQLAAVLVYRTLVLRRSPLESRPPSVYRLVWRGRFYEVWQRPPGGGRRILLHLGLGNALEATAVPACAELLRLARLGPLAAVERPPAVVVELGSTTPGRWSRRIPVEVPTAGSYSLWLGGSFRDRLELDVDGRRVATVRNQLVNAGQYTPVGSAHLPAGSHLVTLRYAGPDLEPGSGGVQFPLGPLVLSATTADVPVRYVPAAAARSLCGRRLDWVEALAR